jgi:uncharacterized protein (TIGR00297 family)
MQFVGGLLLAVCVSFLAYLAKTLTRDGAIAAAVLGAIVFDLGGWDWAILLLVFFASSSLLGRWPAKRGSQPTDKYAKGSRRDAGQVVGNGGAAAILVVLHAAFPQSSWPWLGYAAALAAVTADTWATELGVSARTRPRLITDWRRTAERGTSGGVTIAGTAAAMAGSALVGALASQPSRSGGAALFWYVLAGGVLGTSFDSFLGATVQAMYVCSRDNLETEQHPLHRCGAPTNLARGWSWLNNDWVNFGCGVSGALTACALQLVLRVG